LWTGKGKKSAQKKQSEPSSMNGYSDEFHNSLQRHELRHSHMLLAGIQANFGLDPPIKTFGADACGKLLSYFLIPQLDYYPLFFSHHNLKSRLAFLDRIFFLTSGDSARWLRSCSRFSGNSQSQCGISEA